MPRWFPFIHVYGHFKQGPNTMAMDLLQRRHEVPWVSVRKGGVGPTTDVIHYIHQLVHHWLTARDAHVVHATLVEITCFTFRIAVRRQLWFCWIKVSEKSKWNVISKQIRLQLFKIFTETKYLQIRKTVQRMTKIALTQQVILFTENDIQIILFYFFTYLKYRVNST